MLVLASEQKNGIGRYLIAVYTDTIYKLRYVSMVFQSEGSLNSQVSH